MTETPSTASKIVNFVMFQAVWFAIVLSAAEQSAWVGIASAVAWLALHLTMCRSRGRELRMIAGVTACGFAVDQISVASGFQVFDTSSAILGFVPLWIGALWSAFATTLRSSLSWIQGRYILAAVMGAVAGPIVYVGAENLGALTLGDEPRWMSLVALGVEWAVMMPVAIWFARTPVVVEPGPRGIVA